MNGAYGIYDLAEFPESEYRERLSKIQKSMRAREIDTLLLTNDANVGYFTGYRGTSGAESVDYAPAVLILPAEGTPKLVISVSSRGNVEAMSPASLVEPVYLGWADLGKITQISFPSGLPETVAGAMEHKNKKIGAEVGGRMRMGVSLELFEGVRKKLPDSEFVDASGMIWEVRMIKSTLEISYLRKSCDIACRSFDALLNSLKSGITERELARVLYRAMIENGYEDTPTKLFLNTRAGWERYTMCDTRPSTRPLRRGDSLVIDGGGPFRGYFSDITRIATVGEPTPKQKELYNLARDASELGAKSAKAGAKVGDIYRGVLDFISESGYEKYQMYEGIGHGIGLDIHEPPYVSEGSRYELKEGMVITIEPCIYDAPVIDGILSGRKSDDAEGVFFVEDEVLITSDGPEVLSFLGRELFVVD